MQHPAASIIVFGLIAIKTESNPGVRKKDVPFSMAMENVEIMHECCRKHLRGNAREQQERNKRNETEEEVQQTHKNRPEGLTISWVNIPPLPNKAVDELLDWPYSNN